MNKLLAGGLALSLIASLSGCATDKTEELPNILWIVSEDNSPFLGCYGDSLATTPNLDKLAENGYLYTHAYANAPVCAPARNTIITGVYANSNGNQHMRSRYSKSETVKFYPTYLREKGYYCTNRAKEDYNTIGTEGIWDESSNKAHYSNRVEGQHFFHIVNIGTSHESSIHKSIPTEELTHDPEKMVLPPYHPDTKDMRHDWAQYYDKITAMDKQVGEVLFQLEEDGLADNTIVFYYGDHGGVIARSKRYVYESGTHVPFIIRIPEKFKGLRPGKVGAAIDRLVSFVDLAPTMLSLTGISIPDYMQGNAFLGDQKSEDPQYAFMFRGRMDERYDMSRAVRDEKYRYIHNYMPYRVYGQKLEYLWRAPSIRSWEKAFEAGECNDIQSIFWNTKPVEELYDTENDPWEVNNLADDPDYKDVLVRMRNANVDWVKSIDDCGFIPEAELTALSGAMPRYDYVRSGALDIASLVDAAEFATMAGSDDISTLLGFLSDENSAIRYWGATGLLILGEESVEAKDELIKALNDPSMSVRVVVAEILYGIGEEKSAKEALSSVILSGDQFACTHALNAVDCLNISDKDIVDAVIEMTGKYENLNRRNYDLRAAGILLKKWDIVLENSSDLFD